MRMNSAHNDLAELRTTYAQAAQRAEQDARSKEQEWQQKANQTAEVHHEEMRIIGDQLDTAIASLHNRPNRPAPGNVPKTASTCKGATGAELSRPDAELLTRIAGRADHLRAALKACYEQYDGITR
jgi:hypothetical protein